MALSFSAKNATPQTYSAFIAALRNRLTTGRPTVHGIPVLPRREEVPDAQRFLLVHLTNYDDTSITVALDVVDVYVVGYAAGSRSYFLKDRAENPAPIHTLFRGTTRTDLHFDGTYNGLSRAAVQQSAPRDRARDRAGSRAHEDIAMLERIPLGRNELDNAISKLLFAESESAQASAIIVIIQMLSEAARFRFIEGQISTRMGQENPPYIPDPAMRSLENSWSALSEQIQRVPVNEVRFNTPIRLQTVNYAPHVVDSVESDLVRRRGIAMLLYYRVSRQ